MDKAVREGYPALRPGDVFTSSEPGSVWGYHEWTVTESRPDDEPGQWRVVAQRFWAFGIHTMTTFWPVP